MPITFKELTGIALTPSTATSAYADRAIEDTAEARALVKEAAYAVKKEQDLAAQIVAVPIRYGEDFSFTEAEKETMNLNYSIGGVPMNKLNYDTFWRLYNAALKNGSTKGEAFRYAANDYNTRRTMGEAAIAITAAAGVAGVGLTYGKEALRLLTKSNKTLSGREYIAKKAISSAISKTSSATVGAMVGGFISKYTGEWTPYYGGYSSSSKK